MRAISTSALLLLTCLGCSGNSFAPVSGTVTLNGKPLAGVSVNFQPIAPAGKVEAGPGSSATTDENGAYRLKVNPKQDGAWVGKHRVMVTSLTEDKGSSDAKPPRGGWPMKNAIPARYNSESKETFDVPPGGTDKADFALTSP